MKNIYNDNNSTCQHYNGIFHACKASLSKLIFVVCVIVQCFALTSCSDFLTITPQNEIVLENFWTEEDDVNSVVTSCYAQLANSDCISRMIVWGELRSDNMTNGASTNIAIRDILKENILETNTYTTWECFYQCINRCNTVIYYAPEVQKKDPNFTPSELEATIAEATILRSLCYFYLLRTFRDVPYITEPSIDDTKDFVVAATPFETLLNTIINDVESVKDKAVRSYGENSIENTCRITRWAAYALLADMYLWKGDYNQVINYCDLVINEKIRQYEEMREKDPTGMTVELYGQFPLISESPSGSINAGNTYNELFGTGNSFESIFELSFERDKSGSNSSVSNMYGSASNPNGTISAPVFLYEEVSSGQNKYFRKTDCRYLENLEESSSKILIKKYVNQNVSFKSSTTTGALPTVTKETRSNSDANWIIYRLSDVMLMKAEAEVELAGNVAEEGISEEQTALYRKAFACVSAIWKRANNKRTATVDTLVFSDYSTSKLTMEDLVLGERQREFMFEGKRWYDLVRLSLREKDNARMIEAVIPKFEENGAAIRIRLAAQDALFWPYSEQELKSNKLLKQNEAYNKKDDFEI
ncbi:MAG: RagB/SusD family nutrient uptake outer membrane protein [Prevotellaceae bacterium]|nr:RagB/SusD family nutrient uptake outer membrane protein [Candidatus Colivivens equi]